MNGKVQKHQNFEQELGTNRSRIEEIESTVQALIEAKHYASGIIVDEEKTGTFKIYIINFRWIFRSNSSSSGRNRSSLGNFGQCNR